MQPPEAGGTEQAAATPLALLLLEGFTATQYPVAVASVPRTQKACVEELPPVPQMLLVSHSAKLAAQEAGKVAVAGQRSNW